MRILCARDKAVARLLSERWRSSLGSFSWQTGQWTSWPGRNLLPHRSSPDATYTDASKLGHPLLSGASAVLSSGTIAVCRVPGVPNYYKAELVGAI